MLAESSLKQCNVALNTAFVFLWLWTPNDLGTPDLIYTREIHSQIRSHDSDTVIGYPGQHQQIHWVKKPNQMRTNESTHFNNI